MAMSRRESKEQEKGQKPKKEFFPSFLNKKKGELPEKDTDKGGYNPNKPFEPRLPGVNLIPQSVLDGYALRAYQGKLIKIVAVLIIVMLLVGAGLFGLQKITEYKLASAKQEEQTYAQQVKELQPYETYKEEVSSKSQTIGTKMATEIDTGEVSSEIRKLAKSSGVKLTSTVISVNTGETATDASGASTGGDASSCVLASPFNSSPSVGCVSFTGEGDRSGVAKFLEEIDGNSNFSNAFVPKTSAGGEEKATFEGTVNFSGEFMTNNYSDMLAGTQGQQAEQPTENPAEATPGTENGVTP